MKALFTDLILRFVGAVFAGDADESFTSKDTWLGLTQNSGSAGSLLDFKQQTLSLPD